MTFDGNINPARAPIFKLFRSRVFDRRGRLGVDALRDYVREQSKRQPDYKDASAATSYRHGLPVSRLHMDVMFTCLPWRLGSGNPCRNDEHITLAEATC